MSNFLALFELEFIIISNEIIAAVALNFALGFYLITALQWYNYKLSRVAFHYTRFSWHLLFFFAPWLVYIAFYKFFVVYFAVFLLPFLVLWHKKLDKKLVFTRKIKAFFAFLGIFVAFFVLLSLKFGFHANILPLIFALILLKIFEIQQNAKFTRLAKAKLAAMPDLTIVLITASFGKTSIKNFLFELLNGEFIVHKTPRSVNTELGIIADINENLPPNAQIYIAEAGARQMGDIAAITQLLKPQICIVGEVGEAHLEYFKSLANIRATKLEALLSPRLKKAFLHSTTGRENSEIYEIYDTHLKGVNSTLEGLKFTLKMGKKDEEFSANLLGAFNAQNLCVAALCAEFLGVSVAKIKEKITRISPVEHRLQIISRTPKFIIDDGFNGNFKGMSESYLLCKSYAGRRVLVSPGIVEVSDAQNKALCEVINECFDLAIVIGESNARLLSENLSIQKLIVHDKRDLVGILATHTKSGDLILFSNDTPSFM